MIAKTTSREPPSTCHHSYVWHRAEIIGQACFAHHGDEFWIKDRRADGWYIRMEGEVTGHAKYQCTTTRTAAAGWQVCRGAWWASKIPEGRYITFSGSVWSRHSSTPIWRLEERGDELHVRTNGW
jgi:hypothetical protein